MLAPRDSRRLHRSVWLYKTPHAHVADVAVTTDLDPGAGAGLVSGTSPISPRPRRYTGPAATTKECSPATASPKQWPASSATSDAPKPTATCGAP